MTWQTITIPASSTDPVTVTLPEPLVEGASIIAAIESDDETVIALVVIAEDRGSFTVAVPAAQPSDTPVLWQVSSPAEA